MPVQLTSTDSSPSPSRSPESFCFPDTPWLGGRHDGYPLLYSLKQYFDARKSRATDTTAVVQALLTFGVLEATLQMKIPESSLIRMKRGKPVLVDDNIRSILRDWRQLNTSHETRKAKARHVKTILVWAHGILKFMTNHKLFGVDALATTTALIPLQIACLLETIHLWVTPLQDVLDKQSPDSNFPPSVLKYVVPESLFRDVVQRGWCPILLKALIMSPSVAAYCWDQPPSSRTSPQQHALCAGSECAVYNIFPATRPVEHIRPSCRCSWVKPSIEDVKEALTRGMVPVLELTDDDQLLTRPASNTPYIAISHVGLDGLGSTTERGLPLCRVKEIAAIAHVCEPGRAFWMDSLCVPAAHSWRRTNTDFLERVYRGGAAVLALDQGLRGTSSRSSLVDTLWHVVNSGWMQCSETRLQGILAQKLLFEFSDGPVSEERLVTAVAGMSRQPAIRSLGNELMQRTMYMARPTKTRKGFYFSEVPWLGGKHDGYRLAPSLREYLELHGMGDGLSELAQVQTVLTFGVLEVVLQERVSEAMLVCARVGGSFLVDENLDDVLQSCRMRLWKSSEADIQAWAKNATDVMGQAYDRFDHSCARSYPECTEAVRSLVRFHLSCFLNAIRGFCVTIMTAFKDRYNLPSTDIGTSKFGSSYDIPIDMLRSMSRNGWCKFLLRILASGCPPGIIDYASTQSPWVRNSKQDHARCTTKGCAINNMDTSNYKAKHVRSDCTCGWVQPPVDEVRSALSKGDVPVVEFTDNSRLVVHSAASIPYAAISHVWADGLGSTTEDGLPLCQVKKLATMAREAERSGAFWMDSLCVPKQHDARKKAIGLMAQVYRDAAVVLVLDQGIRSISSHSPLAQKLLRIAASGWMQRLWTLQEALLARNLVFRFEDAGEHVNDLLGVRQGGYVDVWMDPVVKGLIGYLGPVLLRAREQSFDSELIDVLRALLWRTSSREHDQTLAVAGLLRIDAEKLASEDKDMRLPRFFLELKEIPSSIPFLLGKKLGVPGFRWAPATLMPHINFSLSKDGGLAKCTKEGLEAEYYVMRIPLAFVPRNKSKFFIRNSIGCWRVTVTVNDGSQDEFEEFTFDSILMVAGPLGPKIDAGFAAMSYGCFISDRRTRVDCTFKGRAEFEPFDPGYMEEIEGIQTVGVIVEGKFNVRLN